MNILMIVPDCQMIDRRVLQQARTLAGAGFKVTLLAGFECAKPEEYEWCGVRIVRSQFDWDDQRLKRFRSMLPNSDLLRRVVNTLFLKVIARVLSIKPFDTFVLMQASRFPADIVHVHDLPALKHGVLLSQQRGVPLVFDAHEIYYEQDCLPAPVRKRLAREERRWLPHVRLFMTVNDAIAEYYHRRHGVKPFVLMNCADRPVAGFDLKSREELRSMAGLSPDSHIVLYQGWISAERNISTLVQAAAHLPMNTFLVLIGYGEYEGNLRAIIAGKPWADRVRFLGRVEPERILSLTAGADVGVIPYQPIDLNHTLCSPNKFFEYVQAGVPVVAHDLVFFRSMRDAYGVVEVGDLSAPDGMAAAIHSVAADPIKRDRMRKACKKAADLLNWEAESRKLLDAYEIMVGPDAFTKLQNAAQRHGKRADTNRATA